VAAIVDVALKQNVYFILIITIQYEKVNCSKIFADVTDFVILKSKFATVK